MSQKPKGKKSPSAGSPAPGEVRPASGSGGSRSAAARTFDDMEPVVDSTPTPAWLFVLLIVLSYWGMLHLDHYAGGFSQSVFGPYRSYKQVADLQPKSGPEMLIAKGQALYGANCMLCHGPAGLGSPGQFPPLAGSEWVTGSPARLIRIPNNGLQGPITVKDQPWNLAMAAIGATLSDEDLAAILSYIRNSWGNKAAPITPQQVGAVRAEIGGRARDGSAPWTSAELLKIPATP